MAIPKWSGADVCYAKSLDIMERHGPDRLLIDALDAGDEERIKGMLLDYNFRELAQKGKK